MWFSLYLQSGIVQLAGIVTPLYLSPRYTLSVAPGTLWGCVVPTGGTLHVRGEDLRRPINVKDLSLRLIEGVRG
jgi:hypothetical protein